MNETHDLFIRISLNRMYEHYLPKIVRAIESINQKDLWEREQEHLNSTGGIVVHICEHVSRHIQRYTNFESISGAIENHFPNLDLEKEELIVKTNEVFTKWRDLIKKYLIEEYELELLEMNDVYHLVEHTGYHLGQIVDRAQRKNTTQFQFVQNGINEKSFRKLLEDYK